MDKNLWFRKFRIEDSFSLFKWGDFEDASHQLKCTSQGRRKVLKFLRGSSNVAGLICSPGLNSVYWFANIWGYSLPPSPTVCWYGFYVDISKMPQWNWNMSSFLLNCSSFLYPCQPQRSYRLLLKICDWTKIGIDQEGFTHEWIILAKEQTGNAYFLIYAYLNI